MRELSQVIGNASAYYVTNTASQQSCMYFFLCSFIGMLSGFVGYSLNFPSLFSPQSSVPKSREAGASCVYEAPASMDECEGSSLEPGAGHQQQQQQWVTSEGESGSQVRPSGGFVGTGLDVEEGCVR